MTNEEAIADLKEALKEVDTFRKIYLKQRKVSVEYEKRYASLSFAIKALEQQPITWIVGKDNCQVAVRNMPIDKMQKICAIIGEEEQQPCEDCISREEAIRIAEQGQIQGYEWQFKELCNLPSVTPNYNSVKPELDCISREELINELKLGYFNKDLQEGKNDPCVIDAMIDWAIRTAKRLPSVTLTKPKGKWIQTKDDCDGVNFYDFSFECTECGKERSFKSNYCPNCGADMRESEKEIWNMSNG